jgi:hypothetical protein
VSQGKSRENRQKVRVVLQPEQHLYWTSIADVYALWSGCVGPQSQVRLCTLRMGVCRWDAAASVNFSIVQHPHTFVHDILNQHVKTCTSRSTRNTESNCGSYSETAGCNVDTLRSITWKRKLKEQARTRSIANLFDLTISHQSVGSPIHAQECCLSHPGDPGLHTSLLNAIHQNWEPND